MMPDIEFRAISTIKEEIADLSKLIIETKELVEQFPDDVTLKLGLKSLENRQDQIFKELDLAKKNHLQETFDVVFEAETISRSEIPFNLLGNFLNSFQELVTAIVQKDEKGEISRGPISNEIKNLSQLNVLATTSGSFRIIATSSPTITEPAGIKALAKFNSILECEAELSRIKGIRNEVGTRVMNKYKKFIEVIKNNKANVTFYDKFGERLYSTHKISKELANDIYRVINEVEEMPETIESFTGKLRGIDTHDLTFHFEIDTGKHIRGHYSDKIEKNVKNPNFDEVIVAKFRHNVKYNEANDREIDEWELLELEK